MKDPAFDPASQATFSHDKERKNIQKYLNEEGNPFRAEHGWQQSKVTILLSKENVEYKSEDDPDIPTLSVSVTCYDRFFSLHHASFPFA